jgi:hypothetical protein
MWMLSKDVGTTIGIAGQTLTNTLNRTYGHGFDKMSDSSTQKMVQVNETVNDEDLIIEYAMDYNIWTYPVYRVSQLDKPDGSLVVVFPMTPEPTLTVDVASDKNLGYRTRTQNGLLLSYVGVEKDGYDSSLLLFDPVTMTVSKQESGGSILYDKSKMVMANVTKSTMLHKTAGSGLHIHVSQTLFDYLPVTFGLNITDAQNYSDNEVQTTSVSHTDTLSLTIQTGAVTDPGYDYALTPYVYQHATMGCLVVAYDVALIGQLWDKYFLLPDVRPLFLMPTASDALLRTFSRSVRFADQEGGGVEVSVEVLNNSRLPTQAATVVDFYKGAPTIAPKGSQTPITPTGDKVGTQTIDALNTGQRGFARLVMDLQPEDQVVITVYPDGQEDFSAVSCWAIYPESAYASWKLIG